MTQPLLPEAFLSRMRRQLGDEIASFSEAMKSPSVRGIRLNPLKKTEAVCSYMKLERIPWAEDGYILPNEDAAGAGILHAAGAFYLQEPSAMIPASVLDAKPGEMILDLCASPGGKSTQIVCAMCGDGLLVCNEPVPKRALVLSRNLERFGLPNTVVLCARPDQLAEKWPEAFDALLVDAPCSGEGMFRRDPDTRREWSSEMSEGCARRQREILHAAARLVRPGGRLVYSTCTFNPAENEETVFCFMKSFPAFHLEAFSRPGIDAPDGLFTCYPHRLKGEGQFIALLRKDGDTAAAFPEDRSLPLPSRDELHVFADMFPDLPAPTRRFGSLLTAAPRNLPDLQDVRVYRLGLHLGEIRGKNVVPDHAAALCFTTNGIPSLNLSPDDAVRYVSGETISREVEGWILLRYRGLNIGWGKGSNGFIRNHYPRGLRNARLLP